MPKRIFFVILLLLSACEHRYDPAEPLLSGIEVKVTVGPMCPVIQQGVACPDPPYQATLTILKPDRSVYLKFTTNENGTYIVNLPPGDYILRPESPQDKSLPHASEQNFTVLPDKISQITVTYDSGIR